MTCSHPVHSVDGTCSKELSASVAGNLEDCRRILKAWLIFGSGCDLRSDHMARDWKPVLVDALKGGYLPSEAALDASCIIDWYL